jgi:hypothetical protein
MVAFCVRPPLAAVALFVTLGGCGTGYQVENAIGLPPQALADEVYLRRSPATLNRNAERRYSQRSLAGAPDRPVVRRMAIERDEKKIVTTGERYSERTDDNKSFQQWLEDQRAEEARVNSNLNICRGC